MTAENQKPADAPKPAQQPNVAPPTQPQQTQGNPPSDKGQADKPAQQK